jgi:hypothetical protein
MAMADPLTALKRLERAVDMHLGRSAWTQTANLKGLGYSQAVRTELYAAPGDLLKVPPAEAESLDIAALCAAAREFMRRSIGTKAGIHKAQLRQQAQQQRERKEQ